MGIDGDEDDDDATTMSIIMGQKMNISEKESGREIYSPTTTTTTTTTTTQMKERKGSSRWAAQ